MWSFFTRLLVVLSQSVRSYIAERNRRKTRRFIPVLNDFWLPFCDAKGLSGVCKAVLANQPVFSFSYGKVCRVDSHTVKVSSDDCEIFYYPVTSTSDERRVKLFSQIGVVSDDDENNNTLYVYCKGGNVKSKFIAELDGWCDTSFPNLPNLNIAFDLPYAYNAATTCNACSSGGKS